MYKRSQACEASERKRIKVSNISTKYLPNLFPRHRPPFSALYTKESAPQNRTHLETPLAVFAWIIVGMVYADIGRRQDSLMRVFAILRQLGLAVGTLQSWRPRRSTAVSLLPFAASTVTEVEIRTARVASSAASVQFAVTGDDRLELAGLQVAHKALKKRYAGCDYAEVHHESITGATSTKCSVKANRS